MNLLKDILGFVGLYWGVLLVLALFPASRAYAGRWLMFCFYGLFLLWWAWLIVEAHHFMGTLGVILSVILTPVGMAPVIFLLSLFRGEWGSFFVLLASLVVLAFTVILGQALSEKSHKH